MAISVNPPPFLRLPKAFQQDAEVRAFVEQQNIMLFQLWRKTGGNTDPISDIGNEGTSNFSSQLQQVTKQLNGLPEFTMDTEGFTMDTTDFTMDKVIA
jgi:hypothetical protein